MKRLGLVGTAAALSLSACGKPKELTPGDAVIWTQTGVSEIISCVTPDEHKICRENGTDEMFDLGSETPTG